MLHRLVTWLGRTMAGVVAIYVGIAIFERLAPEPSVTAWRRFANPNMVALAGLMPGWAVIETTGRTSGLPRQSPVGGRLKRHTFWLVCAERHRAQYVKNIEANPRESHLAGQRPPAHLLGGVGGYLDIALEAGGEAALAPGE
jgi:hypothetical protein